MDMHCFRTGFFGERKASEQKRFEAKRGRETVPRYDDGGDDATEDVNDVTAIAVTATFSF